MLKTKSQVDKHATTVLARIKDEQERKLKGYHIAALYVKIKEYDAAKRYLGGFLSVKENFAPAYKLLGQIHQAQGHVKEALEAYTTSLNIDDKQKDVLKSICEIYANMEDIDPERARYWANRAELMIPKDDVIFRLKEKACGQSGEAGQNLEALITDKLVEKPRDVTLNMKLIQLYLDTGRVNEAYTRAVELDQRGIFSGSLDWHQCLIDVLQKYREASGGRVNGTFHQNLLLVESVMVELSLQRCSIASIANSLFRFDETLQRVSPRQWGPEWQEFAQEMEAQYFGHLATFVLLRAQKEPRSWTEAVPMATWLYLVSYAQDVASLQAPWYAKAAPEAKRLYDRCHRMACNRASIAGHMLRKLCVTDAASMERIRNQFANQKGRGQVFEAVYTLRHMKEKQGDTFLMNSQLFVQATLRQPTIARLKEYDKVSLLTHADNLHHLVWMALQYSSSEKEMQVPYMLDLFPKLQFSSSNINDSTPETVGQMDAKVFLMAATHCADRRQSERRDYSQSQLDRPLVLPPTISEQHCSREQADWWTALHQLYSNVAGGNLGQQRLTLQRGLATVRLQDNHGMDVQLVIHIARSLEAQQEQYREGSEMRIFCAMWTAHYWRVAVTMLNRLASNKTLLQPKRRLFDCEEDPLSATEIQELLNTGRLALGKAAKAEGKYDEALEQLRELKDSAEASYCQAQIYKQLAQEQSVAGEDSHHQGSPRKEALEALYDAVDRLKGNHHHELYAVLHDEIEELESQLGFPPQTSQGRRSPDESEESFEDAQAEITTSPSREKSPLKFVHSTPAPPPTKATTPSSGVRTRPSPERILAKQRHLEARLELLEKREESRDERPLEEVMSEQLLPLVTSVGELQKRVESTESKVDKLLISVEEVKVKLDALSLPGVAAYPRVDPRVSRMGFPGAYPAYAAESALYDYAHALSPHQGYPLYQPPQMLTPHLYPSGVHTDQSQLNSSVGPTRRGGAIYNMDRDEETQAEDAAFSIPDSQLVQEWPYNNAVHLEGRSTVTYAPQHRPTGQAAYATMENLRSSPLPQLGTAQATAQQPLPGPGYFSPQRLGVGVSTGLRQPSPAQMATTKTGVPLTIGTSQASAAVAGRFQGIQPGLPRPDTGAMVPTSVVTGEAIRTSFPINMPGIRQMGALDPNIASSAGSLADKLVQPAVPSPVVDAEEADSGDEDQNESYTGPEFEPVMPLPAEVQVITGEENYDVLYKARAKLFRYTEKEWKERGIGEIKVIFHPVEKHARVVMRREQINKVCLNHYIKADTVAEYKSPDEKKFLNWSAVDYSDEEPAKYLFTIKFKTEDVATEFKQAFEKAQAMVKKAESEKPKTPVKPTPTSISSGVPSNTPASDLLRNLQSRSAASTSLDTNKLGGFSFSSQPIVTATKPDAKEAEVPKEEATKPSPFAGFQFSLEKPKEEGKASPFQGFKFALGTTISTTTSATVTTSTAETPAGSIFGSLGGTASPAGSGLSGFAALAAAGDKSPAFGAGTPAAPGFTEAGKPLFQQPVARGDVEDGEDVVDHEDGEHEFEPNDDFKPIIPLPDLVEQKTGEENSKKLFSERAKLYRHDPESKQWKERGLGEIKILKDNTTGRCRIVMHREQVLKLCANHWITADMKLTPMLSAANSYIWLATDFSEGEARHEKLAVKFKKEEKAEEFKKVFELCVEDAKKQGESKESKPSQPAAATPNTTSLKEKFKPKAGSWECNVCYIQNESDRIQCMACETPKPGCEEEVKAQKAKQDKAKTSSGPKFTFGSAGGAAPASSGSGFSFGQPAAQPAPAAPSGGGFSFGGGGFNFGASTTTTTTSTDTKTETKGPAFTKPESTGPTFSFAAGGFKFGQAASQPKPPAPTKSTPSSSTTTPAASFSFKSDAAIDLSNKASPPKASSFVFGSDKTYTFQAVTPVKPKSPGVAVRSPLSPQSPEYYKNEEGDDSHIYFEPVVPLPEKVEVKTGEEGEEVLFTNRAKLFRFVGGEWKERGLGDMKVLRNQATGGCRLLMRRDQVLKICCNHAIASDLDLKPMTSGQEQKAWVWHAEDFSEGEQRHEQFAVRFKTEEIASRFKQAVEDAKAGTSGDSHTAVKEKALESPHDRSLFSPGSKAGTSKGSAFSFSMPSTTKPSTFQFGTPAATSPAPAVQAAAPPLVSRQGSGDAGLLAQLLADDGQDGDVVVVGDMKVSPADVQKARSFLLPDNFYTYLQRKPCKGCIGCQDDFDFSAIGKAPVTPKPESKIPTASPASMGKVSFGAASTTAISFADLAAESSTSPPTGFKGGASGWSGAGAKLFASPGGGEEEGGDEDSVISFDPHYDPIVPLPALVETKTGEEDDTVKFSHRAKLYRWDSNQWKERGVGDIKILTNNNTGKSRLLMRREQVLKVCCNHQIGPSMKLEPLSTSETSLVWQAMDYSEKEAKFEQFAIKFKKKETMEEFRKTFIDCQNAVPVSKQTAQSTEKVKDSPQKPGPSTGGAKLSYAAVVQRRVKTESEAQANVTQELFSSSPREQEEDLVSETAVVAREGGSNLYHVYGEDLTQSADDWQIQPTVSQPLGDQGNPYIQAEVAQPLGDKGNPYYAEELTRLGGDAELETDGGNLYYTSQLGVKEAVITSQSEGVIEDVRKPYYGGQLGLQEEVISSHTAEVVGDRGNPYYSAELDEAEDIIVKQQSHVTGDKGNPYYAAELDLASQETATSASQFEEQQDDDIIKKTTASVTGDKGNPYYSKELDAAARSAWEGVEPPMVGEVTSTTEDWDSPDHSAEAGRAVAAGSASSAVEAVVESLIIGEAAQVTGDQGNPHYAVELRKAAQVVKQTPAVPTTVETIGQQEEGEETEGEELTVVFDKRVTMFYIENNKPVQKTMGDLSVMYDEDVQGYRIQIEADNEELKCNHIICQQNHIIAKDKKTCEWTAQDYSTDDPVRRTFRVLFSSSKAAQEFVDKFKEGVDLARQSDISEGTGDITFPREITHPETVGRIKDK